ncbi:MAG: ATP-binding protein [Nitrospinota bacterium]|nr:ATP-binding protein [Nitrospinota bacterium]
MFKKTLHRQLYLSYLLITLLALGSIGWYTVNAFENFYYEQTSADLEARARLIQDQVSSRFNSGNHLELERLAQILGQTGLQRVTLVFPDGVVAGDSDENPSSMDNHADRPEVKDALAGGTGTSVRNSKTLGTNLMYVALPVYHQGQLAGVLRLSIPLTVIDKTLKGMLWKIVLAGLLIALAATPVSLYISGRISRPLSEMKEHAEQFAAGQLDTRIRVEGPEDVVRLAESLNSMAVQLDERLRTVTAQRNEQEAILSSMVEGVIAVDSGQKVISLNQAAARLLDVPNGFQSGQPLTGVLRNKQLQEFVKKALSSSETVEADILIYRGESEQVLKVIGAALRDVAQTPIGAVIVVNDITRLKRLENMRRDFVANVSHELKTPITSIKGFIETLLGGAMESPEDSKRFLEIVESQAERLNAIIDDLLSLSQLEQDSELVEIEIQEGLLKPVLEMAVRVCSVNASKKNILLEIDCPENIRAPLHPQLFEQALINLVDNAIKYSQPSTQVRVAVSSDKGGIKVAVTDEGRGIEKEHFPRLFERFYRVDRDRSREMGGTGLGLAIVKHIAQVHGGSVSVDSTVGKGSTFRIHLPAKRLS